MELKWGPPHESTKFEANMINPCVGEPAAAAVVSIDTAAAATDESTVETGPAAAAATVVAGAGGGMTPRHIRGSMKETTRRVNCGAQKRGKMYQGKYTPEDAGGGGGGGGIPDLIRQTQKK